ncbi:hypothetical protein I4F81_010268 [Pyropia yezoensis]|uniref:Uncharacterized protein n=2 Tax=Pyropia yezoensis TaxID=2788 RepID=A0ACC3CC64_PYRYE|nr:hypothetical protein I4F81_010268 [Neopyropia yezoensis]|eukprot:contig_19103_g4718
MAGLGDLWDLILASLEATLFTVYLFTFRATRSFLQWASPPRTSATHRTVLLVGDGLAEGVGDTLAVGGLAARINTLFAAAVREARMPHTTLPLKLNWSASSAGRLHASSADWLPPPSTALGLSPAGGGGAGSVGVAGSPWPSPPVATKNLFASTFLSGRHATPDIVIILLGGVDARVATAGLDADVDTSADAAFVAAAAITAANILTLARYCSANGSAVCIGTVPAFAGVTTPAATAYAREVNRLLRAGVADAMAGKYSGDAAAAAGRVSVGGADGGVGDILLAPDVAQIAARGADVVAYGGGAATLNSAGYRPLARLCMDGLVGAAKKVEWRHWRAALGNRS